MVVWVESLNVLKMEKKDEASMTNYLLSLPIILLSWHMSENVWFGGDGCCDVRAVDKGRKWTNGESTHHHRKI